MALSHQVHQYRPQRMPRPYDRFGQRRQLSLQFQAKAVPAIIHREGRIVPGAVQYHQLIILCQRCQKSVVTVPGYAIGVSKGKHLTMT